MSIIDSNARWEDEDKAMAEMLDALPTPEQEEQWGREIDAEIDQMQRDMAAEYAAHAEEELRQDFFEALERYVEAGLGFTRTTLADLAWEVYVEADPSASVTPQRTRDDIMEDQWLDSAFEDRFEVDCP